LIEISNKTEFHHAMDFKAEQEMELEALQSIYPTEFHTKESGMFGLALESGELNVSLCFQYTPKYPEELPEYTLSSDTLPEESMEELESQLKELCQDSLGMVMIFTLSSHITEYLQNYTERMEEMQKAKVEQEKKERELKENLKFMGTKVTLESFTEWKRKFDEELRVLNREKLKSIEEKMKKLSGRQLFELNKVSETEMELGEGEADVEVDEMLFEGEDLENLELEDSD
jgi:predicted GNAT family acetyltransferase